MTQQQKFWAAVIAVAVSSVNGFAMGRIPAKTDASFQPETVGRIQTEQPREPRALTLQQCYALALKQSEVIAQDAERIKEAEARFLQAFGSLLPHVSFQLSKINQDSGIAFSSLNENGGTLRAFVFQQTLFSGFREFAAMAGSKMEQEQRRYEKQRAEQLLYTDVSDAFYLLLEQQEDLKALGEVRQSLVDRIAELKKRAEIGRSRQSEIVNTETGFYNIEAEIELIKSREQISQELLSFLIGGPVGVLNDPQDTPESLGDEVNYTVKADFRPDVKAAEYAWGVSQKAVTIAKSDFFPTVSVEGDYFNHRSSAPLDETWATLLKVDVPIFQGTETIGAVKAARAQERQAKLEFQRVHRLAAQDISDAYIRASAGIRRKNALDQSLKSAELNYSLQKQDYQQSLVSNLDVLAALQSWADTKRTAIQTFYEKKRFYRQLQASVGNVGEEK
jgi:outer membrane protein TolC